MKLEALLFLINKPAVRFIKNLSYSLLIFFSATFIILSAVFLYIIVIFSLNSFLMSLVSSSSCYKFIILIYSLRNNSFLCTSLSKCLVISLILVTALLGCISCHKPFNFNCFSNSNKFSSFRSSALANSAYFSWTHVDVNKFSASSFVSVPFDCTFLIAFFFVDLKTYSALIKSFYIVLYCSWKLDYKFTVWYDFCSSKQWFLFHLKRFHTIF